MGYADIRHDRRHEADAAKIRELEQKLKERRAGEVETATPHHQPPQHQPHGAPTQTVIVNNEGCLAGAGKGCLCVIIAIMILALIGKIINMFAS